MGVVFSFFSTTRRADSECAFSEAIGGCYYSSWKTEGWWRLDATQCATLSGDPITNRNIYVYAKMDDGRRIKDSHDMIYVRDRYFLWDDQVERHYTTGECFVRAGVYDFCTREGYWVPFYKVDVGTARNFIFTITD